MCWNLTPFDGQYSAFGEVVSGMDVADEIVNSERDARDNPIESIVVNSIKIEVR